jgi:hypothetical protein
LPRFARIRVNLDEEEFPARLVEIEVQCLTAVSVRCDDAAFESGHADWNAQGLKRGIGGDCDLRQGEGREEKRATRSAEGVHATSVGRRKVTVKARSAS